jgi:hypothetical protein
LGFDAVAATLLLVAALAPDNAVDRPGGRIKGELIAVVPKTSGFFRTGLRRSSRNRWAWSTGVFLTLIEQAAQVEGVFFWFGCVV